MKLSLLAPIALALLVVLLSSEVHAEERRLGAVSDFFQQMINLLAPVASVLNSDVLSALLSGDSRAFLDAITNQYAGHKYFGHRRLAEEELVIDTPALLATNPTNDVVDRPGVDDLDKWLLDQEWSEFTSDIGRHEQRDQKNVQIKYVKAVGSGSKGAMVLAVGNSEPVLKYSEIIYDLIQQGYSPVYSADWRGQGFSTRLIEDGFKNHVEESTDYPADMKKFINTVVKPGVNGAKTFLTCHSMGCAISFDYLVSAYEAGEETVFNAVVAFAPLVKADTSPFPYPVAVAIGAVMEFLGLETEYAPTKEGSFLDNYHNGNFAGSTTQSVLRWTRNRDRCVKYEDSNLCLGGVTGDKALEFFQLNDNLEAFMQGVGKLSTPTLIQMAGNPSESDGLVLNPETQRFCNDALASCTLTKYPTSRHHIWTEKDDIRTPAMNEAFAFFDAHSGAKKSQCERPSACGQWNYSWRNWGCKNPSKCSYNYKFGDIHLGQSCRPKAIAC